MGEGVSYGADAVGRQQYSGPCGKSMRDRNNPTCTLSQNGYGAQRSDPNAIPWFQAAFFVSALSDEKNLVRGEKEGDGTKLAVGA